MKQLSRNLKNKNLFSYILKFSVFFLFLGIVYQFSSSGFLLFSPVGVIKETPSDLAKTLQPSSKESLISTDLQVNADNNRTSRNGKCDLFVGDWVPDPSSPYYTNNTCSSIQGHQNCMKNGRPDAGYLSWRWNPRGCKLPKFNPTKFLALMRNKSMAFVGDSIIRNHVQSLLCTLSLVEEAVEVLHDKEYRSRIWFFPSHNFTLSEFWSPFLSKATIFEDDTGLSTGIILLHLDEPDTVWTNHYKNFDYLLIAGGKWFLKNTIYYENNTTVGCHNCQEKNIIQVGFEYAYRKVLNSTLNFITSSKNKVYTIFRTITPDHFENGGWSNGGYCNRTRPFKEEGEVNMNVVDKMMHIVELEEFERAAAIGSEKGMILKLLDTTNLSLLRPDGHPGAYRQFHPFAEDRNAKVQHDCLHWCLPGPIDSWNELMLEMLLSS